MLNYFIIPDQPSNYKKKNLEEKTPIPMYTWLIFFSPRTIKRKIHTKIPLSNKISFIFLILKIF
jgi:hypothetical protein